jgi:hypothetical protein
VRKFLVKKNSEKKSHKGKQGDILEVTYRNNGRVNCAHYSKKNHKNKYIGYSNH